MIVIALLIWNQCNPRDKMSSQSCSFIYKEKTKALWDWDAEYLVLFSLYDAIVIRKYQIEWRDIGMLAFANWSEIYFLLSLYILIYYFRYIHHVIEEIYIVFMNFLNWVDKIGTLQSIYATLVHTQLAVVETWDWMKHKYSTDGNGGT